MSDKIFGQVKWFSNGRGFGFIHPLNENGEVISEKEYFVHFSSINIPGFKTLSENQKVVFEVRNTDKGSQAVNVEPMN